MTIRTILVGVLSLLAFSPLCAFGDESVEVQVDAPESNSSASEAPAAVPLRGDGTLMDFADSGFSIAPPEGWEVYRNYGGATLLMQVPHAPELQYQRAIQILRFSGPKFIDQPTADEFAEVIRKQVTASSGGIANFSIRNHMVVDLRPDLKGALYYTSFAFDTLELMQVHILVSSATHHYVMTYTDLAEHFESDANPNLTTSWRAMTSIELDSRGPTRLDLPVAMIIGLLSLAGIVGVFTFVRKIRAGREYATFAQDAEHGNLPPELPQEADQDDATDGSDSWEPEPEAPAIAESDAGTDAPDDAFDEDRNARAS